MRETIFIIYIILLKINSYSESIFVTLLPIIIIVIGIFNTTKFGIVNDIRFFFRENKVLAIYLLLLFIGVIRSSRPTDQLLYIFFFVLLIGFFSLFFFTSEKNNFQKYNINKILIKTVILPFCLLSCTNIILYILDIKVLASVIEQGGESEKAALLGYLGIDIKRIEFPLEYGFNDFAVYIGGIFTLSLSLLLSKLPSKSIIIFSLLIFVTILVSIDSRSSLYYPLIIISLLTTIEKYDIIISKIKYIALLIILGPILMALFLPLLGEILGESFISRGDGELANGNSRFIIWGISALEFINFKIQHIFGYGSYGHFGSGVSKEWAFVFPNWSNPELKSPHNTGLSLLFDLGYIGLFLYVRLVYDALKKSYFIFKENKPIGKSLICYFIFIVFSGITESLNGFYFFNHLLLFIMLIIYTNMTYNTLYKNNFKRH